jgi:glycosyltransferase involved in cell wall biosynthesis
VVQYLQGLQSQGEIDCLMLSKRNLGKIGALQILFNAAPGEMIAYADDDIFFYPSWLEAHLEVLEAFPQVGMVSGVAVRDRAQRASQTLQTLINDAPRDLSFTTERRIPVEWETDWALSTGRAPAQHRAATQSDQEIVLKKGGVEAIGCASHFQFVGPKEAFIKALPVEWTGRLMGQMIELDEAVDALGFLRLSTAERYVRHIGNALSQDIVTEARRFGLEVGESVVSPTGGKHWLLRIPGSRRLLRALYDWTFSILHRAGNAGINIFRV